MASKSIAKTGLRMVIGGAVIAGVVYAVFFVDWRKKPAPEPQPVRPLKMFTLGRRSAPPVRDYPGKVAAKDKAVLAFQVSGQVLEFPTLKGQQVKKGEVLAKLDDADFQNRVNAAKANYNKTKVYLERIKKAVKTGAVSRTDLSNAQAAFEQADANLKIAQKELSETVLRAPYDAIIADTYVDQYETIRAKEPILAIQDINNIEVEASVPQERILEAKALKNKFRHSVTFDSLPDTEFDVEVREFTTKADPKTQTYTVTFTMPIQEKYNILPGMTATVREYPKKDAFPKKGNLVVPIDAAVIDGQGQYYVWKIQKNGDAFTVHRQNVTVGKAMGEDIEILSGLEEGDRIAAQGVHLLQEGQSVREYKIHEGEEARQ